MDHTSLRDDIPAYVAGRVKDDMRRHFEVHLATCRECQELVEFCEALAAEFRSAGDQAIVDHPTPLELRSLGDLDTAAAGRVEQHLASCLSCTLEVAVRHRRLEEPTSDALELVRPTPTPRGWTAPLLGGVALGAAAAILAVMLWLPPDRGVVGPTSRAPEWIVLEEPTRGGSPVESVTLPEDQASLPLGVRFTLPQELPGDSLLRFSIENPRGATVWVDELTMERARARLRGPGLILLVVPSGVLSPGRYELEVLVSEHETPWVEIPFEVHSDTARSP